SYAAECKRKRESCCHKKLLEHRCVLFFRWILSQSTQQQTLTSQEPGHGRSRRAFRRKCSVDQRRRNFGSSGVVSRVTRTCPKFRSLLRNFGGPPALQHAAVPLA